MSTFLEVDPTSFIHVESHQPAHGRGAWSSDGMAPGVVQYQTLPLAAPLGTGCETDLAHWAIGAGVGAIQRRLENVLKVRFEHPTYGARTAMYVEKFQEAYADPASHTALHVDGIVGPATARALFTPLIDRAEDRCLLPAAYLRGLINHESVMDPGAVGYFVFYGTDREYRGIDRGLAQINSKYVEEIGWLAAFTPPRAIRYAAEKLRETFDGYRDRYPHQQQDILWDAALCAHNSPVNGNDWARDGAPPNATAANYVAGVRKSIY